MEKVILTGANGFIGRQTLVSLLERNYEVHAVSNTEPTADLIFENVIWHQANLLEKSEVEKLCRKIKATHLLHFAWYVEHGKFWNAPENKNWLDASIYLTEKFKLNGGKRIVIAGTCAEYEWGKDEILSEENTPLKSQNFYGECKLELQKSIADLEVSQAWGRIFFLFGEYEHPNRLISSVINSLLKNDAAECSHGGQIRDFMYVGDVADAFAALLDSNIQGAVNIGSGKPHTIKEIVLKTANILNRSEKVLFGKIPSPENEPKSIVADTNRLRNELNWREKHGVSKGLERTINYWKNYESNN